MQWQEHRRCSNLALSNSTKATKSIYRGIREEEQKGELQISPRSTSKGFPHKEEILVKIWI
jgi:hypothetical protein